MKYLIKVIVICAIELLGCPNNCVSQSDLIEAYNEGKEYNEHSGSSNLIFENLYDKQKNKSNKVFKLFSQAENLNKNAPGKESNVLSFKLNQKSFNNLLSNDSDIVEVSIDFKSNKTISLILEKYEIVADDQMLVSYFSDNENVVSKFIRPTVKCFKGYIQGNKSSIASAYIFEDRVELFFNDSRGAYQISSYDGRWNYIAYNRWNIESKEFKCGTKSNQYKEVLTLNKPDYAEHFQKSNSLLGCIEVLVTVDYDFFSSFDNEEDLFNSIVIMYSQANLLFELEQLTLRIGHIGIFSTIDPWQNINDPDDMLTNYIEYLEGRGTSNPNKNRVWQLLVGRNLGGGLLGFAFNVGEFGKEPDSPNLTDFDYDGPVSVIVDLINRYDENDQYPNLRSSGPSFTIAHEIGHNLGSEHTHGCYWNGNNTAIDGCGSRTDDEGSCPIPSNTSSGTVMSYCSNKDATQGFGIQPGDVIRDGYLDAVFFGNGDSECLACPDELSFVNFNFYSGFRAAQDISIHSSVRSPGFDGLNRSIIAGEQIILTGTSSNPTILQGNTTNLIVDENACYKPVDP